MDERRNGMYYKEVVRVKDVRAYSPESARRTQARASLILA